MIIGDTPKLKQAFIAGLETILGLPTPTPGQLVLVAANAITIGHAELLDRAITQAGQLGYTNANGPEDEHILSFLSGVTNPSSLARERHTPHGWLIEYNELRSLRPKRLAGEPVATVKAPFNPANFNYAKVPHEAYAQDRFGDTGFSLYFNKYPFAPYHSLIVPEPNQLLPQYLEPEDHAFIWDLHASWSKQGGTLAIGYNAHGAYASVNQLHFQLIPDAGHLPILNDAFGTQQPLQAHRFEQPAAAWRAIAALQQANQPFNIVYLPGRMWVFERAFQGTYQQPAWTSGFAWYELSGAIIIGDEAHYRTLTDSQIQAALTDMQSAIV